MSAYLPLALSSTPPPQTLFLSHWCSCLKWFSPWWHYMSLSCLFWKTYPWSLTLPRVQSLLQLGMPTVPTYVAEASSCFYSNSSIWPLHIILISDFKYQMQTSFTAPFTHICISTTSTAEVPAYTHWWLQGWKALHPYGNCIQENNISSTLYDWLPRTWRFFWREAKHLSNECGRTHPHRNQRQAAKF